MPVHTVRRTGRPRPKSNYELFNCNNLNIRYWSWNYRGCWPCIDSTPLAKHPSPSACAPGEMRSVTEDGATSAEPPSLEASTIGVSSSRQSFSSTGISTSLKPAGSSRPTPFRALRRPLGGRPPGARHGISPLDPRAFPVPGRLAGSRPIFGDGCVD